MTTILKRTFPTVTTSHAAAAGEPVITISTLDVDRVGDRMLPDGFELENYRRNPVVLYGHDTHALPVGTTTSLTVEPRGLKAQFRWLENDPFADRVRNAHEQGILRAASVGFISLASTPNEFGGRDHTQCELVEWSLVAVPANPAAVRALKRLGLSDRNDDHPMPEMIRTPADLEAHFKPVPSPRPIANFAELEADMKSQELSQELLLALATPEGAGLHHPAGHAGSSQKNCRPGCQRGGAPEPREG